MPNAGGYAKSVFNDDVVEFSGLLLIQPDLV